MAHRTCSIDGCARPHRARGYCSTHYNRLHIGEAARHPRAAAPCVVCATVVTRRVDAGYATTCSVRCRTIVQHGHRLAPVAAYSWRSDAAKRARNAGAVIVEVFDRDEIFTRDGWVCQGCEVPCTEPNPFVLTAATVDHVVALAAGGEHSRANAQTMCLSCNSAKHEGVISSMV